MAIDPKHDPVAKLKASVRFIYAISAMNVLLGSVIAFGGIESLQNEPGWPHIIVGVVIGLAGYITESRRSKIALAFVICMFTTDWLFGIWTTLEAGDYPPIWTICIRIFLLIAMFSGFNAINKINSSKNT